MIKYQGFRFGAAFRYILARKPETKIRKKFGQVLKDWESVLEQRAYDERKKNGNTTDQVDSTFRATSINKGKSGGNLNIDTELPDGLDDEEDFNDCVQEKISKVQIGGLGDDYEEHDDHWVRQENSRIKKNRIRKMPSNNNINIDIDPGFITNGFKKCQEDPGYLYNNYGDKNDPFGNLQSNDNNNNEKDIELSINSNNDNNNTTTAKKYYDIRKKKGADWLVHKNTGFLRRTNGKIAGNDYEDKVKFQSIPNLKTLGNANKYDVMLCSGTRSASGHNTPSKNMEGIQLFQWNVSDYHASHKAMNQLCYGKEMIVEPKPEHQRPKMINSTSEGLIKPTNGNNIRIKSRRQNSEIFNNSNLARGYAGMASGCNLQNMRWNELSTNKTVPTADIEDSNRSDSNQTPVGRKN